MLFSDVEGSTKLLRVLGREQYVEALDAYRALTRQACAAHSGVEVEMQGDCFHFAFPGARVAIEAAAAAQRALAAHPWPGDQPLRVRIGLHTGEPARHGQLFAGLDLHRAARVMSVAHGGQVVLSRATRDLLGRRARVARPRPAPAEGPGRAGAALPARARGRRARPGPARRARGAKARLRPCRRARRPHAASSDPEDLRASLEPYQARVQEQIEGFGGTVERFVGSEVLAFGAARA